MRILFPLNLAIIVLLRWSASLAHVFAQTRALIGKSEAHAETRSLSADGNSSPRQRYALTLSTGVVDA